MKMLFLFAGLIAMPLSAPAEAQENCPFPELRDERLQAVAVDMAQRMHALTDSWKANRSLIPTGLIGHGWTVGAIISSYHQGYELKFHTGVPSEAQSALFRLRMGLPNDLPSGVSAQPTGNGDALSRAYLAACFPALSREFEAANKMLGVTMPGRGPEDQLVEQQARERATQDELEKNPANILGTAYIAYVNLKRCEEDRRGYMTVYVSEPEMARARLAVKRIEEKMAPKLTANESGVNWAKADLWRRANELANAPLMQRTCQFMLQKLMFIYREQVPEDIGVRKDF